jgi:hypothetical protein
LGASSVTATREDSGAEAEQLLEAAVEGKNMWLALSAATECTSGGTKGTAICA